MKHLSWLFQSMIYFSVISCNSGQNKHTPEAPPQQINSEIDDIKKYSYFASFKVDEGDHAIASTVFFLRYKGNVYLVSAWHSFSGKNPWNNYRYFSETGGRPPYRVRIAKKNGPPELLNITIMSGGSRLYMQPKASGYFYDIAAIRVENPPSYLNILDLQNDWLEESVSISDSVFYYGFRPDRAVNSEAEGHGGKVVRMIPTNVEFYTLMHSYHGCSGSPVFTKKNGRVVLVGVVSASNDTTGGDTATICPFKEGFRSLEF